MSDKLTKQEVSQVAEALANWFVSQEINVGNSAIVMIHLLAVITGDCARDANDLVTGLTHIKGSLEYNAAKAFAVKHNLI